MRKVSSAPSLVEVSNRASSDHHAGARMGAKTSSAGSLARLGGIHYKEDKRQGGMPRKSLTHALPPDAHPFTLPSDQILPEEFAESAKGLAGMDCFELYGGSKKAPDLLAAVNGSTLGEADPADDANAYALASCLNTPYTGEDKNLGELVNSQAKVETQAAVTRLEAQYQKEVSSQLKEQVVDMEEKEQAEPKSAVRRRRLMELLGLQETDGESGEGLSSEDRSDIANLLMTSLDDSGQNRIEKPGEWRRHSLHPLNGRKTGSEDLAARCRPRHLYSFTHADPTSY